jgi:hypothetical protein
LLARGLRNHFGAGAARSMALVLFEKFKEKKVAVVSALHETLDALLPHSLSLNDIADDLNNVLVSQLLRDSIFFLFFFVFFFS